MIELIQPPLLLGDDAAEHTAAERAALRHGKAAAGTPRRIGKHPKNTLNELDGDAWLFFTKSVITTAYPSAYGHRLRKAHGANKPPQLMATLIEFFTTADGRVLDPFAGVGGTLIGAAIASPPRECVGVEINQRWVEIYGRVVAQSGLLPGTLYHGDSLILLQDATRFPSESFDFICTDPPYNVHLEQTMANDQRYTNGHANRRTDYNMRSKDSADLANLESYESFLDAMQQVLRQCFRVLKAGKYLAIILRDAYQNGRYVFTHVDVARRAEVEGFVVKGEKVWYQAGTRLRPYGYPFAYIPNITHQYIVIFQKPKAVVVTRKKIRARAPRAGGDGNEARNSEA